MTSQDTDIFASISIGITAVICLFMALYMSAYSTKQNNDAAIDQIINSIPYFNKLVDYMDKALFEEKTHVLPVHTLFTIKKIAFRGSVAAASASPHYEDDFFFADLPSAGELAALPTP